MRARKPRWYSLTKPKLRQSWNKYNLYNIASANLRQNRGRTFFQQKWAAKSATRGYHGAHIKESDWNRAFSRRLFSAVDMPPDYLASFDGSEQAAGRGSGLHAEPGSKDRTPTAANFSQFEKERQRRVRALSASAGQISHPSQKLITRDEKAQMLARPVHEMTPYMQMAYAPLERRLDVAIFRAMFASSTLQAKQFCTHGAVKVNGKLMRYGAYKLNPGDMFQVDIDSVLYATGRAKTPAHAKFVAGEDWESKNTVRDSKEGKSRILDPEASEQAAADTPVEAEAEAAAEAAVEKPDAAAAEEGGEDAAAASTEESAVSEEERRAAHRKQLKALVRSARSLISDGEGLNPRKKRQLRAFMTETKRVLSSSGRVADAEAASDDPNAVMDHLSSMLKDFKVEGTQVEAVEAVAAEGEQQTTHKEKAATETINELVSSKEVRQQIDGLSREEQKALASLLRLDAENPIDESKPYWTPWEPRRYMAPFAFIPRYLEVNQNICAAVYLRHPVARRGMAEVPTPFSYEVNQLAFNWYLRRH